MKVKYLDKNGYDCDKVFARKSGLIKDQEYEVESIKIHSSSTDMYLVGYKGHFNSVMFDDGDKEYQEYHKQEMKRWYRNYCGMKED